MEKKIYEGFVRILEKELMPALGCTEPIALAYAAAKARQVLGAFPEKIVATCSGNIIKNVKGVVVPATGGLRGIEAAVLIGAVGGDPSGELEVLASVTEQHRKTVRELLQKEICEIKISESKAKLHIIIEMWAKNESSLVEIIHTHTGIVRIEKSGQVLLTEKSNEDEGEEEDVGYKYLDMENIYQFANEVRIEDVKGILDRQIEYNMKIAEAGMNEVYGANVGKTLVETYGNGFDVLAKALPAAGSDARMSGCELPVIINSGSGNQGITVSVPVVEYARELQVGEEKMYRALVLSNLLAIHQKTRIGRLSAYCGAVSAGSASGAAICYLHGGDYRAISHCLVNSLAVTSGIICDGAKPSCAAKIAFSIESALLGYEMFKMGNQFRAGEGIVSKGVENTIINVGRLGKDGMRETDKEILRIMTGC